MVKLIIPILLIGLGLLSDIYLFHRYINTTSVWRWIWWLPMLVVIGFFIKFLFFNKGFAEEYTTTNIFLLVMVLICIPKMLFALFSLIPKVGPYIGLAAALGIIFIVLWGITIGFCQLKVKEVVYTSPYIPKAFDGYRIAMFSDTHVGSFYGPYKSLLQKSMDTINNRKPDIICFVGDIENFTPDELAEHKEAFSSLHAPDGVFSIMGNHDYSSYLKISERERTNMVARTRQYERDFGWTLLENDNRILRRGNDSIVIIGEENWGKPPFPQYGNLKKALGNLHVNAQTKRLAEGNSNLFTIMLSHDPTAWKSHILPVFRPDITLSGHTHGTQLSLFGWSPSSTIYDEWGGAYYNESNPLQKCLLYVSTGLGGNFPFRFAMPREVVIITLQLQ